MQPTKILSRNGTEVAFHTGDGGLLDLSEGSPTFEDLQGFTITIAPGSTEGLLMCKPWNSDIYKLLPFFKGYNPRLLKGVKYDAGNTATGVYWEK